MKKNHILKLTALALMVVMTLTVAVTSTYAWLTMSSSPVLEGLRVTVAGDNTIKVAEDMTKEVNGTTIHYPAPFSENLNLSISGQYQYLKELKELAPVSTVDGVHWFLPNYYTSADREVQLGSAMVGTIMPVGRFTMDTTLQYANLTEAAETGEQMGHYAYFDLWVMSPSGDCDLRVATGTGDDNTGSYVISLPDIQKDAEGNFALNENSSTVEASARVGFLVNELPITDNEALQTAFSEGGSTAEYKSLRGIYAEKDGSSTQSGIGSNSFTIYEPNADSHPQSGQDGDYIATYPIGLDTYLNQKEQSVFDRLTVQKSSQWLRDSGGTRLLDYQLQKALLQAGGKAAAMDEETAAGYFYSTYLQGQYSFLVQKGRFFAKSVELSTGLAQETRSIAGADLEKYKTAGATEDAVIVRLQRNVPQRIRVFIWLEGQDADCTGAAENLRFAVNLQLAGANS